MSLKYRDSQGTETPVAGLNGTSGELVPSAALQQSGSVTITQSGTAAGSTGTVTFQSPMPDTDYIINIEQDTTTGGIIDKIISNKTVNGFTLTIYWESQSAGHQTKLNWTAFKLMTDIVHEADAAHIAQNTANFAPAFSEVTSYAVGDYVTYNNILYRCTTAHTAGVWVAGHFTAVTVGGQLKVQDISSSITTGDGYAGGTISVYRDGNTIQVLFNSIKTTAYSRTICSGLPRPLHSSYFCVQGDGTPQELGLASLLENGSITSGASTAGLGPSKVWDGFITYLTRD